MSAHADPRRGLLLLAPTYWRILAAANHQLGDFPRAIKAVQDGFRQFPEDPSLEDAMVRALAANGQERIAGRFFSQERRVGDPRSVQRGYLAYLAYREYGAHGHEAAARRMIDTLRAIAASAANDTSIQTQANRVELLYLTGQGQAALAVLRQLTDSTSEGRTQWLGYHGLVAARAGQLASAEQYADSLAKVRAPYQHGWNKFWRARILAVLGRSDDAVTVLTTATDQGWSGGLPAATGSMRNRISHRSGDTRPFSSWLRRKADSGKSVLQLLPASVVTRTAMRTPAGAPWRGRRRYRSFSIFIAWSMGMGRRSTFLLILAAGCAKATSGDPNAKAVDRITQSLLPPVRLANTSSPKYQLADRMALYQVPGISIAVVDSGRIVWAQGFGLREAGTADSVQPTTRFQAASISKPVAVTAMLRLAEEGKLNLDQDVNSYLTSWKVPENRHTTQHKVTLRRIVSHSAGLTVHGFPGYRSIDTLPSVPEILDGKKPANTGAVRVDTTPGSLWRYSGGGTTVMQLILMDVTGEPFAALVKRLVLEPAGMTNSSYDQPLASALVASAAAAHERDGSVTPGKSHTYPEQAAAGLWTTPTDLLKWAIAITEAWKGSPGTILSRDMARQMLTVQKGPAGLGPMVSGKGRALQFGHGGSNQGFRSQLIYFPATGQGAALMTNGEQGSDLINEVVLAIAAEYGWPEHRQREIVAFPADSVALDRVVGTYRVQQDKFTLELVVTREGPRLFGEVAGFSARSELVFLEATKLIALASGNEFTLAAKRDGTIEAVLVGDLRLARKEK